MNITRSPGTSLNAFKGIGCTFDQRNVEFEQTTIKYLRLIILEGRAEMDLVKVQGVAEWPVPNGWKEVQSFLGFANFYCWFIEGFSHHTCLLFDLTKKGEVWCWGEVEQSAFIRLKRLITPTPILAFPKDSQMYRVEADSSDFTTGATLSQQSSDDGKWHPIAFLSKSLSPVERNYEIHDKEMLALSEH